MGTVQNPILSGFNPDPSLLCVGNEYYIATSTFEWFPGIQIHHSTDLVSWKLLCRPLDTVSLIDLKGDQSSGGVWAPCLSYSDGLFYLIYSNVRNFSKTFYDVHNYLVTAESITGPWSEPVFLNSSGFDPSLFHDDDGRTWLVNMICDYRPWKVRFGGIVLQEYSCSKKCLIGEPRNIFRGTPDRTTEGPHLYKKDGYYYLFCAEGGTSFRHQEIVARSRSIDGPYELSPKIPLITSWPYPANPLQKSGHASITKGPDGSWYLANLCSRPVGEHKNCILGRETALQKLVWKDGWPELAQKSNEPLVEWQVNAADTKETHVIRKNKWRDDFDHSSWNLNFQSLRVPLGKRASLNEHHGWLRLYGKESLESCFEQSLLACRQQHFHVMVDTIVDFQPVSFQQTAGLVYYYDGSSFFYTCITSDEDKGRVITCQYKQLDHFTEPVGVGVPLAASGPVRIRLETNGAAAQFSFSVDGADFAALGPVIDATVLSDDYYEQHGAGGRFTGAFIGICCQDLSGRNCPADFDYFSYQGDDNV